MTEANSQLNVDPEEISRFEHTAQQWWDSDGPFRALHDINPTRLNYIEDRVGGLAGQRVLDIGCGGGLLSEGMAIRGADTLGIDMSPTAIAVAREHAEGQAITALSYLNMPLEQLETQHFDLITCLEMLEHVPDPQGIVAQAARRLKPGGHLIVSTIDRHLLSYLSVVIGAEYVLKLVPRGTHDYRRFIRPAELAQWAQDAHLTLQHQSGLSYNPWHRRARLSSQPTPNYFMHFILETV